jgi:hypothetical protein
MAYPNDGYGVKSALHAALDTNDPGDYFTNSQATQLFEDRGHFLLSKQLRDITAFFFAPFLMNVQKFTSSVGARQSSPESYLEDHQESLYEWSYRTVEPFL